MRTFKRTFIAALLAPALTLPASATLAQQQKDRVTWNQEAWYRTGLSASEMLDKPVLGENGERIGDVKDIIVDRDGQISKLVVEVGGFFEIGDQHIGVPWRRVTIGQDMQFVQVPLQEVRSGTYSLFGRVPQGEQVPAALTSWRVNELIGDYASLSDVPRYGIVSDVVFDASGKAQAVVVRRSPAWGGHGLYAFPFTGYYPATVTHPLPYTREAVVALRPFDYAQLGRQSLYAGASGRPRDPAYPEYAARADNDRSVTLTGTVVDRSRRWTPEGVPHDMMTLRTHEGRVVAVDLGPPGGEGTIHAGDQVTVKGHPARAAGKDVVSAHTVIAHTRSPTNPLPGSLRGP